MTAPHLFLHCMWFNHNTVIKTHDAKIKTDTLINGIELITHMQASIPIASRLSKKRDWRKDSIPKFCWQDCLTTCRIMKLDPYLSLYIKHKSKWIKVIVHGTQFTEISWRKKNEYNSTFSTGNDFLTRNHILHWVRPTTDKLAL